MLTRPRLARGLSRLDRLDRRLYVAAHARDTPALDRVLPPLTSSADHGLLWFAVAGAMLAAGQRRPALRGLVSLGLASAVANVPAKLAVRRVRPENSVVPVARHLLRFPTTSSFPSGHSASAAAFTVGVALEKPLLAAPVGLLAAGVAYGRVHTGVHYPGDVAAGLLLGTAAAYGVRRVWPSRPGEDAARGVRVEAPSLPDGAGFVLVVNVGGGSADQADAVEKQLAEALPRAEVVRTDDLAPALRQAAERATVLGIMGGDGSVNCAAGVALEAGLPLAVVPGGTLNHFAGELALTGVDDVIEAIRTGSATRVSVGSAAADGEGLYFLNTFAIGIYPEVVRERERLEDRWGKWPAMAVAAARVMRRAECLEVEIDGEPRHVWTLFAGNGRYHPAGFAPTWRERLDDGVVDVRIIDADARLARTRMTLALMTGRLGRSLVYEDRVVGRLSVRSRVPLQIARDGESHEGPEDLLLRAVLRPLVVYRP